MLSRDRDFRADVPSLVSVGAASESQRVETPSDTMRSARVMADMRSLALFHGVTGAFRRGASSDCVAGDCRWTARGPAIETGGLPDVKLFCSPEMRKRRQTA